MLQQDLLHLAGDDGGVELAGEGRHLVQTGARWGRREEVSQEVRMELIFHLLRMSGTLEVASPSSSCVQPEGPVVGLNLAGRGLGRSRT